MKTPDQLKKHSFLEFSKTTLALSSQNLLLLQSLFSRFTFSDLLTLDEADLFFRRIQDIDHSLFLLYQDLFSKVSEVHSPPSLQDFFVFDEE